MFRIVISTDKDQKSKVAHLQEEATHKMEKFSLIYNKIAECSQTLFETCTSSTTRILKDAEEAHQENSENAYHMYSSYQEHLYEVAWESNKLGDYIHLCV